MGGHARSSAGGEAMSDLVARLRSGEDGLEYAAADELDALRAENARLRESAELNADYHRREMKLQTEIASLALEESSAIKAENARLRQALKNLLDRDERYTCQHEETHRGGFLWEICDCCGAKWADDMGGKTEWKDPPEWVAARAALDPDGQKERRAKALSELAEMDADLLDVDPEMKP